MASRKYPLEPLFALREAKADQATRALGGALRAHEAARHRRLDAQERRDAHAADADRVRGAEEEALSRGERRVVDVAWTGAWQARVSAEHRTLVAAVDEAVAAENRALETTELARRALAERKTEAKVVSADRERWRALSNKQDEAKLEEELSELRRPSPS